MSKRVDYYILSKDSLPARMQYACRIVDKAYRQGHKIYINTGSIPEAHQIDELLWTFNDISFVPHHLNGDGPTPPPPVQVGHGQSPSGNFNLLINLDRQIPGFYQSFHRVIEIIPDIQDWQQQARDNFRYYRGQGCQLETHKIQL